MRRSVRVVLMLALAGSLAGCGDGPDTSGGDSRAVETVSDTSTREASRRDMLGSAIARGPAWEPGRAIFTTEQATRGEELFLDHCTACHGLDNMTSGKLRDNWTGRTVGDFYEYVRYAMPYDVPGRLSADENADLVAFIFRENGLPPGSEPLSTDIEELQAFPLTHPDSVVSAADGD